jgi:ATP-dependent Clp protease adaptor protein ClpS
MEDIKTHGLTLYNDNIHDFGYIMSCLVKFCGHDPQQAEQCATIAHFNGKCNIKNGDFLDILDIHTNFERMEVRTEIESYESSMY